MWFIYIMLCLVVALLFSEFVWYILSTNLIKSPNFIQFPEFVRFGWEDIPQLNHQLGANQSGDIPFMGFCLIGLINLAYTKVCFRFRPKKVQGNMSKGCFRNDWVISNVIICSGRTLAETMNKHIILCFCLIAVHSVVDRGKNTTLKWLDQPELQFSRPNSMSKWICLSHSQIDNMHIYIYNIWYMYI